MGDHVEVRTSNFAQAEPNFIIRHRGKLYVTVAVLEYDENADRMTREQRAGVAQIQKMFEEAGDYDRAAFVEMKMGFTFQSTNPPRPPTQSDD